jgi:DNA repair exonuclease SbcCD nuclease subunit
LRFLFRTDVHVADRSPVSWKADYPAEVYESLRQIGVLAAVHDVEAVLDGGDFFHVKTPSRNSHGLIVTTTKIHQEYPCPTYSIEGNHDIVGNNLSTIEEQPLGVLYATKVFRHLRDETFERDGIKVRVVGVPYSPSRDLREIQELRKGDEDCLIAVVHALAGEDPPAHVEEFFGEAVFRYSQLVFDRGPDVFCFGHWHKDQGVVQLHNRWFVNQGAVSRGALSKDNVDRTPKVSLIEVTKAGVVVTALPLNVAPASEVYDLDRKDRQEKESKAIDLFVQQLEDDAQIDITLGIEENIRGLTYATEIKERALQYLERVRSG